MGPLGGADLRFCSPQPDTSLYCGYGASASRGVSVYFSAAAGTYLLIPEEWKAESTWLT